MCTTVFIAIRQVYMSSLAPPVENTGFYWNSFTVRMSLLMAVVPFWLWRSC